MRSLNDLQPLALAVLVCAHASGCRLVFGLEEPVEGGAASTGGAGGNGAGGTGGVGASGAAGGGGAAGGSGGAGGSPACIEYGPPSERLLLAESFKTNASCWSGGTCEVGNCSLMGACCGLTAANLQSPSSTTLPDYVLSVDDVVRLRASGQDADDANARLFIDSQGVTMNLAAPANQQAFTITETVSDVVFGFGNDDQAEVVEVDCVVLNHTPSAGRELMPDPSFEEAGQGWVVTGTTPTIESPSRPMCGAREFEIACPNGGDACVVETTVCVPDATGTLGLWLSVSEGNNGLTPTPTRRFGAAGVEVQMARLAWPAPNAPRDWFTYNDVLTLDGVDDPTSIVLRVEVEQGTTVRLDCASATFTPN